MNTACIVVLTKASAASGTAAHNLAIAPRTLRKANDITAGDGTIGQHAPERGGCMRSGRNGISDQTAA